MWLLRSSDVRSRIERHRLAVVAFFGVAWTVASVAIFLPFLPYRYETLRVHSLAQFGSILVFAVITKALTDRYRPVGFALLTVGVLAASVISVQNARMWLHWSDVESQLLSAFTAEAVASQRDTVVVRDETSRLANVYELGPYALVLGLAYSFITDQSRQRIIVCSAGDATRVGGAVMGDCIWSNDELIVPPLPGSSEQPFRAPRGSLLDLTLHGGDQPQLRPTDGTAPQARRLPARVEGWLTCLAGQRCATHATEANLPTPPFVEGFTQHYSYERDAVRGAPVEGFGPLQPGGGSSRWTTSTDAAIFARLGPGRYRIRVRVLQALQPTALKTATLAVNGSELPTRRDLDGRGGVVLTAVGTVPASGSPVADRISVRAPVGPVSGAPGRLLGMIVSSFTVAPVRDAP
jgi:hypothetical protein